MARCKAIYKHDMGASQCSLSEGHRAEHSHIYMHNGYPAELKWMVDERDSREAGGIEEFLKIHESRLPEQVKIWTREIFSQRDGLLAEALYCSEGWRIDIGMDRSVDLWCFFGAIVLADKVQWYHDDQDIGSDWIVSKDGKIPKEVLEYIERYFAEKGKDE